MKQQDKNLKKAIAVKSPNFNKSQYYSVQKNMIVSENNAKGNPPVSPLTRGEWQNVDGYSDFDKLF